MENIAENHVTGVITDYGFFNKLKLFSAENFQSLFNPCFLLSVDVRAKIPEGESQSYRFSTQHLISINY